MIKSITIYQTQWDTLYSLYKIELYVLTWKIHNRLHFKRSTIDNTCIHVHINVYTQIFNFFSHRKYLERDTSNLVKLTSGYHWSLGHEYLISFLIFKKTIILVLPNRTVVKIK